MENKIREILVAQNYCKPGHHLGKPFLSGYQIAIEFAKRFPEDYKQIGHDIGGKETGQPYSLAVYISRHLSGKIKRGEITDIEGGFISNLHLRDIVFARDKTLIRSSLTGSGSDMSIFRAITPAK